MVGHRSRQLLAAAQRVAQPKGQLMPRQASSMLIMPGRTEASSLPLRARPVLT